MIVFILVLILQGIVAYKLNVRESLSTMCMTTVSDPFSTSVLLVVFIMDSVRCSESSTPLLTTKLKLKHASDESISNVTNVSDDKVSVYFPDFESNIIERTQTIECRTGSTIYIITYAII